MRETPITRQPPQSRGGALFWGVQVQSIDATRLDAYLASVADQEEALGEAPAFTGRLVLRSQRDAQRFWVIDGWNEERAMVSASIMLRTLSSVAGLTAPPREVATAQVPVGSAGSAGARAPRAPDAPLPFFLIGENWVKPVALPDYLAAHEALTADLVAHDGFAGRLLLRDLADHAHFFVVDEWRDERAAFEAFETRQSALSEARMTGFLTLLAERAKADFALGIHG
ncbi:MAG: antibiotic biosynthesis monooxygenase [Candidatus Dormibacteria bacterium]